jgi:hypothetical protein
MLLVAVANRHAKAFTPKNREHRTAHPAFKAGGMVKEKEESSSSVPVPGSTPAFAFANPAASMSPAVMPQHEEEDDEMIGYGTALVSCVISLALGFSLGYVT